MTSAPVKDLLETMSFDDAPTSSPSSTSSQSQQSLADTFGITNENLKFRKEFLRIGKEEQQLMHELIPWAEKHAELVAKQFYDWQFTFSKTRDFFSSYAKEKSISLSQLREHLESAQKGYFLSCFTGSEEGWGLEYFESRLSIGNTHDRINLPFKWYIGSYIEFLKIARHWLNDEFDDSAFVEKVYETLLKIFFLDLQAIGDSFLLNTLNTLGFDISNVKTNSESDRTEHIAQIKQQLEAIKLQNADYEGQLSAINRSQAVIEFDLQGRVTRANANFLDVMGYSMEEIKGQHHRMFVEKTQADSKEYEAFWDKLRSGQYETGEFKRIHKHGQEIWIQASYFPILDPQGAPFKIVKYAQDVTEQVNMRADFKGQLEAINKSQAIIEFDMQGRINGANENFLSAMGYTMDEIKGKHHRVFVASSYAESHAYEIFWDTLSKGSYQVGEYKTFGKNGKEVWLQASYNPILDNNGNPFKVVTYATDITQQVIMRNYLQESFAKIDENAQHLSASSEELSAVSDQMGDNAERTSQQANLVAAAAEEVSVNIQTVAAGAEEMSASIKEVARSANEASEVAGEAVSAAKNTNITVTKLGESSTQIGKVIKVITSIAQQTNLLALNATIEAARAGEAGKGFAVVANEVKELAKQTATATEDISQKIEAIQSDAQGVVQAINDIGKIIAQINDIQGVISAAVEEQTNTTSEIARNVSEAAKGSSEIAENIAEVAKAADSTSNGANDSKKAITELARMASNLQEIVMDYTNKL